MSNQHGQFEWAAVSGPLTDLQKINQAACEDLAREGSALLNECTATALKQFNTVSRTTNPEEYLSNQAKTFAQYTETLLESGQNVSRIIGDTLKRQLAWGEEQLKTAAKTSANAIKTTVKKAED